MIDRFFRDNGARERRDAYLLARRFLKRAEGRGETSHKDEKGLLQRLLRYQDISKNPKIPQTHCFKINLRRSPKGPFDCRKDKGEPHGRTNHQRLVLSDPWLH